MSGVSLFVAGTPAPQGSKRFVGTTRAGRGILIESSAEKVRSWRADVRAAFTGQLKVPYAGPVVVDVRFHLARPKSVTVKRRPLPTVKPDLDKLIRSTLDALKSAGIYGDDAQVVHLVCGKRYADDSPPGAAITVKEVEFE